MLLGGAWAALKPLAQLERHAETLALACGLKVLFELAKDQPSLLLEAQADGTAAGCDGVMAIMQEFLRRDQQDSNLRRHAELLYGLCNWLKSRQ